MGVRAQQHDPLTQRVRVRPYSYADRLLTPLSLSVIAVVLGAVVAFVIDRVAALALAGVDTDPLLQLVATLVAAITTTGTLVMQILSRVQAGRVEAEAGTAARILREVTQNSQTPADRSPAEGA